MPKGANEFATMNASRNQARGLLLL